MTAIIQPAILDSIPPEVNLATCCWYAACTRARHEKKVAQQLEERGIECFLPLYRSARRWKDRRKLVDLVLFPGYIFVRPVLKDRLRVLQLPGVARFVSFNGHPSTLPDNVLNALRNGLSLEVKAEQHPYLTAGRRVKVIYGPLSGAQGVFLRRKNECRLVISIDAIMRSVALEVDEADVVPLF